jgi:hypothetical protein
MCQMDNFMYHRAFSMCILFEDFILLPINTKLKTICHNIPIVFRPGCNQNAEYLAQMNKYIEHTHKQDINILIVVIAYDEPLITTKIKCSKVKTLIVHRGTPADYFYFPEDS